MKRTTTSRPLGLLAALLLMLLVPATLAYGAYVPSASMAPNGAKVSTNNAPDLTFDCTTVSEIPQTECDALAALYKSTNGANWTDNTDWLNTTTPCSWYGVTCSDGHVTLLALNENQLSGTIPPQLGELANLMFLNLHDNQFSGSIPPELENLASLITLNLHNNQFSGGIPSELSNLPNLKNLYLHENQLSGPIPPELGSLSNLVQLTLGVNQLSGAIPPELGNLANLQYFDLHDNQLSGPIPDELGGLSNLTHVYFYRNQLSGPLPSWLGDLTNLVDLYLHENELSGTIPSEFSNLINLKLLSLHTNQLSGSIPSELGNLSSLTYLYLYRNQLSGSIPPELANLTNLTYLSLGSNQLSGSIPPELGHLANLTQLYLYDNQLSGSIPPELENLANLTYLFLYDNQLSGSIPRELANLTNLTRLYLYENQLSGSIPPELGSLANLTRLYLHENQLSGSIPTELANLANLTYLYLANNQLSGSIPPQLGNLTNLTLLYLHENQLSGSIPPELGSLTNLIYLRLNSNDISGSIPLTFTNLNNLQDFRFQSTDLCEPDTTAFQEWLSAVANVSSTNVMCDASSPTLSGVTPNSAVANAGNVPVIISGSDFAEPVTARIGSVDLLNVTLENANTLHAVLPVGSLSEGTHDLTVEHAGQPVTLTDTFTVEPAVAPTQFLAMVYLACDNNLASSCRRLFNNLELAMTNNPNLRVAVFWDGRAYGDSAYYLVQPDNNPYTWASYDESQRVSLGEMDSADPGTLVQFVSWAQSQYPGEYNFLSLVDHGNGWAPDLYPSQIDYKWTGGVGGMFWDDTSHNVMSTQALAGALDWISDGNTLDALYLDACQMGTVEVMAELAPYAQYVIAHENFAWATYPYDQYFNGIDGNSTPSALAQQIAQVNRDSWPEKGHPTHIAVVNSSQMDHALGKLDALASQLLNALPDNQVRLAIDEIVRNTAHIDENTDFRINGEDSSIDLYHFASLLNAHASLPDEVKTAAQELMSALDDTIEANYTHSDTPWPGRERWDLSNLHGLSVYFPLVDEWKRAFYGPQGLPRFSDSTAWDDFIQAWYGGTQQRRTAAPEPPTERCPECLIAPMHTALTIGTPDSPTVGQPVWVPVWLSGVETEDDLRGVQISVQVTDTNTLAPADELEPRLGEFFPQDSYTYAVHSSNGQGWDYILTDVGDFDSQAVSGEGVMVELPFYAQAEGCVYVEFKTHLLGNHQAEEINHYQAGNWICTINRGTLSGQVFLQSRNLGDYGEVRVTITSPSEVYTTTTDENGNYTFLNIYQDEYDMTFTHIPSTPSAPSLFASRSVGNVSVDAGGTATIDVGLWAGDIDQDGDVDRNDEKLLEAATVPVDSPSFDINADGETNVFDLIILQHNKGRPNLNSSNPPQGRAGTVSGRAPDANSVPRHLGTNDKAQNFRLPANGNGQIAYTLRAEVLTGTIESIGTRLALPAGTSVTSVELTPAFAGGQLFWEQIEDKLYIVAAPELVLTDDTDVLTINMNATDEETTVTVEAVNKVGWGGELVVPEAAEVEVNLLYLPMMASH